MAKKLLLLLLLVIFSLLPCSGSVVKFLPGFEGHLPFELETGFVSFFFFHIVLIVCFLAKRVK